MRVHRVAEAAGRRLAAYPLGLLFDVVDVVPPVEPPQQRRLAVEAAVVQRQVLALQEAGVASRRAALELLERKWITTLVSRNAILMRVLCFQWKGE